MYCKWCGMDSKNTAKCEWCGKPLGAPSQDQTVQMPSSGLPTPTSAAAVAADKLAYKPMKVDVPELPAFGLRFERYISVMLVLLAGGFLMARFTPSLWLVPLLVLSFCSGLFLAVYRVIGYYEEQMLDVSMLLIFAAFVGPVYASSILVLLSLIRREANWSMLGLMASYFVIRFAIGTVAHGVEDTVQYMVGFTVYLGIWQWVLQIFPLSALFGGWMMASFSRPLNE